LAARNAKICSIAVGRAGAGREIARGIHRDPRRYMPPATNMSAIVRRRIRVGP